MLKRILRAISILFGAALIVNGIFMTIFSNPTIGNYATIILGFIFFIPAIFFRAFTQFLKHSAGKIITLCVSMGLVLCFAVIAFLQSYGTSDNVTYNEEYLIVLGCGLNGETPTEPLRARLDTALDYLSKNDSCQIILTGGQGNGETIPESEAMRRYLTEKGIDPSRIITEDKATSTSENFSYSNKETGSRLATSQAAFITNEFHVYRAYKLARIQGFNFNHMHADTSWYNLAPCYSRELMALVKMIVFQY